MIDTNVLVSALLTAGANSRVLRACLLGQFRLLIGPALFLEYEELLRRPGMFDRSPLAATERRELFASFLSVSEWVEVYYSWRPNLRDEGDNHLWELAVAGGAAMIVTNNVRDLRSGELRFPSIRVLTPLELLKEL